MLIEAGHWQARRYDYRQATRTELERKLGSDHVAWILSLPHSVMHCRGRSQGEWTANNLELMSAYDRLADLIQRGEIS